VYAHAVICEYAHARLRELRNRSARPAHRTNVPS
jgi:hypothetical protein